MQLTLHTKKYGNINYLISNCDFDFVKSLKLTLFKTQEKMYILTNDKKYLHRLILNCPKNKQVHHINGNTLDNRRENLEILTLKEHRLRHSKNKNKLSENDIKQILLSDDSNNLIAKKFNISNCLVSKIRTGLMYSNYCQEIKRKKNRPLR